MEQQKIRILIVENEQYLLQQFEGKLEEGPYDLTVARNGDEATNFIHQNPFDLILLDIMIPKKNGFEILADMKNRGNTTPVIVVTSLGHPDDVQHAKQLGAKDYFVKSPHLTDILGHVTRVLRESRSVSVRS